MDARLLENYMYNHVHIELKEENNMDLVLFLF